MSEPVEVKFLVSVKADGVVKDAEGNIVSQVPFETTAVLTETELRDQVQQMEQP